MERDHVPHTDHQNHALQSSGSTTDPVCGMSVDPSNPRGGTHRHQGVTYAFCSDTCRSKFSANPARYLHPPAAVADAPEWTCPMHPEIVRDAPGTCPICGMALEPRVVLGVEPENPELVDMRRRFRIAALLTSPVLALAMSDLIPGQPVQHALSPSALAWIQLVLSSPVVLWGGWPFFQRAWASLVNRHLNMFTLIGLGTAAAYVFSLVVV